MDWTDDHEYRRERTGVTMSDPVGVVAVFVVDDRVAASASDFGSDTYGGFGLFESQRIRARDALARRVLEEYCSPIVPNSLDTYNCKLIVDKMPGEMRFVPIGHKDGVEYE